MTPVLGTARKAWSVGSSLLLMAGRTLAPSPLPANLRRMTWGRWWVLAAPMAAAAFAACASNDLKNGASDFDAGPLEGGPAGGDDSGAPPPPVDSGSGNGDENPPATACTAPPFVNFAA